ncbi:hypothetical protein ML401_38710 [Bradyrhizobium sp. 62B]|nr:hypothetical protein ML401_38710 [Bradyrhizobium sp. 62B]
MSKSRSRQMLPGTLPLQAAASSCPVEARQSVDKAMPWRESGEQLPLQPPIFSKHIFQFCDGVIMITYYNQICH